MNGLSVEPGERLADAVDLPGDLASKKSAEPTSAFTQVAGIHQHRRGVADADARWRHILIQRSLQQHVAAAGPGCCTAGAGRRLRQQRLTQVRSRERQRPQAAERSGGSGGQASAACGSRRVQCCARRGRAARRPNAAPPRAARAPPATAESAPAPGSPPGSACGRLAEVDQAGGAHALHVATVRQQVNIGLQNLVLGVAQLQPLGAADLAQLAGACAYRGGTAGARAAW